MGPLGFVREVFTAIANIPPPAREAIASAIKSLATRGTDEDKLRKARVMLLVAASGAATELMIERALRK